MFHVAVEVVQFQGAQQGEEANETEPEVSGEGSSLADWIDNVEQEADRHGNKEDVHGLANTLRVTTSVPLGD